MIERDVFRSESGFKPMSAFVVVAIVLAGVASRVTDVSLAEVDERDPVEIEEGLEPGFELVDAGGRTVATFVDRMDLVLSPRSMWLAHTPDHMAEVIAAATGVGEAEDVLAAMLPDVSDAGWIDVIDLELTARQAEAVLSWADRGGVLGPDAEPQVPLAGIDVRSVEPVNGAPRFRLAWQPAVLLSHSEREAHKGRGPSRWTRRLLDGLSAAVFAPDARPQDLTRADELRHDTNAACRRVLWSKLMPTGHCIAVRDVPAERALEVERMLREEGVSPLQMRLTRGRDRRYPTGELEILGSWGRVAGDEPEPLPRAGIELLADRVFADPSLGLSPGTPAAYAFVVHRNRELGRTRYFYERREAEAPARVHTTLDVDLLRSVRRELGGVMDEHRPALAMAMVIDLETGDVLAVDSLEAYGVQPFAPVYYAFTPGSTFKALTMAIALEEGVVHPSERIDVGQHRATWISRGRCIREAEGARYGLITAAECLAFSLNIGLVRIGQRVPSEVFADYLHALGYARYPEAGLGPEHPGMLPPLPWKENWSHASVCFGHEVMTTLWQHAAGLAAVVRGGVYRPLRLINGVEQGGEFVELPVPDGERVFSESTCAQVRRMMSMGATVGTGRKIARPDLIMGTKTGTAEKVSTEVCSHLAGAARARAEAEGRKFTDEEFRALRGQARPHPGKSCYTSSMCVVGRRAEDDRELMVLVVVDEPTGKAKFGSDVAGPAAVGILAEALGRTRDGEETVPVDGVGFTLSGGLDASTFELAEARYGTSPWRAR